MAIQPAVVDYPLRFDVMYPEDPNRFLILVRWLLAIPHLVVVYFLSIIWLVVLILAWFAILFTGRFPEGLFNFSVGVNRWSTNLMAYILFLDEYPPFAMDAGEYSSVVYEIERQDSYSRLLIFVKWLLVIPHSLIVGVLQFIAYFAALAMVVAVLVTGRYPRGIFNFLVGVGRWSARVNAYAYLMTDRYPPFSME